MKTVALMRATERADYLVVNAIHALDPAWRPLGEILVERGLITPAQLQEALDEQKQEGGRLGEILFARGLVAAIDLSDALAEQHGLDLRVEPQEARRLTLEWQRSSFPLGRLLVQRVHITESQLDAALTEQSQTGQRLGQILIAHGAVTSFVLAAALAEQQGLVSASQELWESAQNDPDRSQDQYEVREIEHENHHRLYTSRSFLDATDLAFAVLHEWDPAELHIVRVNGGHDQELCWKYPPS